ncbi:FG-GAP-like repeat-containing protein [Winogradskyella maritima]|uniref:FG-GAP-like repeat-containing protein n=1 Tax=Winogradskyella maritima TaxID=1517766 RepID=A0ABV8ALA5_9FLAO|nr:FG-GAP-like repeat-containing protein [Winogradskyella maritima]
MLKKVPFHPCFCLFILFISGLSYGQNFNRVEAVVGLDILEDNNGVAVADYDGDNDLDIFVVAKAKDDPNSPKTFSRLFRNDNNGSFTDVTEFAGLDNLLSQEEGGDDWFGLDGQKSGASWGDYNNDGFPDLFLTYSYKVQLWRNLGNGTFANVTGIAGFDTTNECRNTGATWFDYDNDGFLDIYISDWDECASNQLYRNRGNGSFEDVTVSSGIQAQTGLASYTALPFDFNQDGFMDLYVSNDFDEPNSLFISSNGSSFSNQAQTFGVDTMGDDMGITIGDYNLDGAFDIFITAIDDNFLLTNNGDNTFTETADAMNVGNTLWAWGTRFSDFDLDGDEDLFVANGYDFENRDFEPNFYFQNMTVEGQNKFMDQSAILGLDEQTISVEAIDFDYDNDGDIDLLITNNDGKTFLYENTLLNFDDETPAKNWFKLSLEGTTSNRNAIGTIVKIKTISGDFIRYHSGVGFLSQSLQPVHFGLNTDADIEELEIQWPSGLVETYTDVAINAISKAVEGQGLTVLDVQPSPKIYGCRDPQSCSFNPEATLDDGSCTYLESSSIQGSLSASVYANENYTYNIANGSTANWSVSGGEILSGQGTNTISVLWEIEEQGSISVVEVGAECSSLPVSITVELTANNLPDNISVARLWNEVLLQAIRGDFARPTVHARNLFHTSVAMYDIWAIYDEEARPYLIGNEVQGFSSTLEEFIPIEDKETSVSEAISYAMYRTLSKRFENSPGATEHQHRLDLLMDKLGYDTTFSSILYEFGNAKALGNYVAQVILDYGLADGSRELTGFDNAYYEPVNEPYGLDAPNNPPINDPNRWQPLGLDIFIDQGGNVVDGNVPEFLGPEWGNVKAFALSEDDVTEFNRNGDTYRVFHDPGAPPQLNTSEEDAQSEQYKWGFSMVSVWQSHLDPTDGVMWDISPGALGNTDINNFPTNFSDYPSFYSFFDGGDGSQGHTINPATQSPYQPNLVPRGDYARVLAEFWADGPDSETPPGHWFTILNYVNDHPQLEKRFQGEGEVLDGLEWDVKSYFILGGGMHDAAISAWSVKGWYDYIRPISAIRYMADEQGQSSDPTLPNYSVSGIELIDGYIEIVEEGDPLAGFFNQNVGKIKLYTWKGHDFIDDTEVDQAGVGWILAEDWYPYQRPTFVTPPFAGYVSGHSTFSRTASELLTKITGDPFFPGGVGEFVAKKNEFLVFEEGPSQDVVLQWATYRDASDQTSLSRIWGGIHPPADDLPGRFIGQKVADDTFDFAVPYFSSNSIDDFEEPITELRIYPNPTTSKELNITGTQSTDAIFVYDLRGRKIDIERRSYNENNLTTTIKLPSTTASGLYMVSINETAKMVVVSK